MEMEITGNKYKTCVCWRCYPGMAEYCMEFCNAEQREACNKQFIKDRYGEEKEGINQGARNSINREGSEIVSGGQDI